MTAPVRAEIQPGIDLADPGFWRLPDADRAAAFAQLRALDRPAVFTDRATGRRFHALVRHADVVAASRTPEVFLSGPGVTTPEPARWVRALFGDSMVNLDDPRHADLRRIVSRAFTPRLIARVEEDIRRVAGRIVDEVVESRPQDFVTAVAAELPYQVICTMMGIPERQRRRDPRRRSTTPPRTPAWPAAGSRGPRARPAGAGPDAGAWSPRSAGSAAGIPPTT